MLKSDFHRLIEDARSMQDRLDKEMETSSALERKLNYARKMLEAERKSRREAEAERAQFVSDKLILTQVIIELTKV